MCRGMPGVGGLSNGATWSERCPGWGDYLMNWLKMLWKPKLVAGLEIDQDSVRSMALTVNLDGAPGMRHRSQHRHAQRRLLPCPELQKTEISHPTGRSSVNMIDRSHRRPCSVPGVQPLTRLENLVKAHLLRRHNPKSPNGNALWGLP